MAKTGGLGLIVGLGNPGVKYADTRHNAGFWFVDKLAERYSASFKPQTRFKAEIARARIAGSEVWLVKPTAFMNVSGSSVATCAAYYKLGPPQTLVAHDELGLVPGDVRLKNGGGHGGHNGLRDIASHFGSEYGRVRIGIGHPGTGRDVANYVLKAPSRADRQLIDDAMAPLLDQIESVIAGEIDLASV